jgi:hypothetical protein
MLNQNCISNETTDQVFQARVAAELTGLKTLTIADVHRYGGCLMDLKLLLNIVENTILNEWSFEVFSDKLRSLANVTYNFAEKVLVLCRPLDVNYFSDDELAYSLEISKQFSVPVKKEQYTDNNISRQRASFDRIPGISAAAELKYAMG